MVNGPELLQLHPAMVGCVVVAKEMELAWLYPAMCIVVATMGWRCFSPVAVRYQTRQGALVLRGSWRFESVVERKCDSVAAMAEAVITGSM